MLKKLLSAGLALALSAGISFAAFNLGFDGRFMPQGSGTAPVLTACGTTPAIVGTDVAGTVTMGTGTPTGCVITFNVPYAAAATPPHCLVVWIATPLVAQSYTTSNAAITLTQTATSSNVVKYFCAAQPGG